MINLYHLKYFYDAVHAKSIAKAASQNRVSHPAVSQAIKSLESRLGVPLLIHAKRRFDVTPQGSILFKRAEALFQHLDETIHALIPENGVLRGPLAIGCSHSLGLSLGSKFFPDFCNENPEVDFSLRIGNSKSLEALLDSRTIEIGLGVARVKLISWETRDLKLHNSKDFSEHENPRHDSSKFKAGNSLHKWLHAVRDGGLFRIIFWIRVSS